MLQFLNRFSGKPCLNLLAKSATQFADIGNRKFAPNSANWERVYLSHLTHWPAACLKGFVRVRIDCAQNLEAQSIDFSMIFQGAIWKLQGGST